MPLLLLFLFPIICGLKKSIKSFNVFFGVFKIKGTSYKSLLISYRLNKAFNSYILIPAFLLKTGAGYNNAITVKTASQIRIIIAGVLKAKRLIPYRKKV